MNLARALRFLSAGAGSHALVFAAGLAGAWPNSAWAEDSDKSSSDQQSSTLQEVVVTAQQRSESLNSVPISVQAYTSEQLTRQAVTSTQDLAAFSPTVNFASGNSANATAFSLRGVSSVAFQSGIQPSTAMVLDGVALAKQGEFVAELGDIDRVEILNGPQGTLFGKNSTAGVISIVTKKPGRDFEALVETLATSDQEYSVRPMLNVPLSDRVRLRVNGFYRDQHPLGRNLTGPDFLGVKSWGVDAKLAMDLTNDAQFLLQFTRTHVNSSYGQFALIGPSAFGPLQQTLVGPTIGFGKAVVSTDSPAVDIFNTTRVTGTLNWNLAENLSLVSITNYSRFDERSIIDSDGTPTGANFGTGEALPDSTYPFKVVNPGLNNRFPIRYHYYSEEARANYVSGPVNAVAGVYYQDYQDYDKVYLPINFDGAVLGLTPGQRYYFAQVPEGRVSDTTASAFGDVTYALTDHIKPFAGLRYTREKVGVDYHRDEFLAPYSAYDSTTDTLAATPYLSFNAASTHRVNNVSGRAGLQYLPTSDLNFYVSFARGYKAPAVDVSQNLSPGADPIIRPELATAYEVGAKLRLFENRLALDIAAFHEDVKDIQEAVQPANSATFNNQLVNAGKLTSKGVEGDIQFAVTAALKLSGGFAYDDATYTGFAVQCSPGQVSSGTCNNSPRPGLENTDGQQAVGSPRWKYTLAGNYEDRLPNHDVTYFALVNWTWSSSVQYLLGDDPLGREPSHGMLNASVGLKGPKDRWEVQAFGKNLTNEFYYASRLDIPVIGQPLGFLPRDFKRYGGVKLTVRF